MTILPEKQTMSICLSCEHGHLKPGNRINCVVKGLMIHSTRLIDSCCNYKPRDNSRRKDRLHETG